MKKRLLLMLFPVLLLVAGAMAVWGDEQGAMQPGCNKCAKMEQKVPCANCPKGAAVENGAAPCANCPKQGADAKAAGCDKCAKMKAAEAAPPAGGCSKCAKLQQPDQSAAQPVQPVQKGCCNKQKAL